MMDYQTNTCDCSKCMCSQLFGMPTRRRSPKPPTGVSNRDRNHLLKL